MSVSIDIETLLTFFDEKPKESARHATAICQVAGEDLGFGLLKHYLESNGKQLKIVSRKSTSGNNKGHRLDGLIHVDDAKRHILYQVEVKNWSAHAIGGKRLPITASSIDVSVHKIERWRREWRNGIFTKQGVLKVLEPMKPPPE